MFEANTNLMSGVDVFRRQDKGAEFRMDWKEWNLELRRQDQRLLRSRGQELLDWYVGTENCVCKGEGGSFHSQETLPQNEIISNMDMMELSLGIDKRTVE